MRCVCVDCFSHRTQCLGRSHCHALNLLLLHDDERETEIALRCAGENAYEGDGASDPGRANGLVQCADAAHLDNEVDTTIVCQLAHHFSPVGFGCIVDRFVGT